MTTVKMPCAGTEQGTEPRLDGGWMRRSALALGTAGVLALGAAAVGWQIAAAWTMPTLAGGLLTALSGAMCAHIWQHKAAVTGGTE